MFAKQNKYERPILEFIQENAYCTTNHIVFDLDINLSTAQKALRRLIERELIHIADFDKKFSGQGKPSREFLVGHGENAKPPKITKSERRAHRNIKQNAYRAKVKKLTSIGTTNESANRWCDSI